MEAVAQRGLLLAEEQAPPQREDTAAPIVASSAVRGKKSGRCLRCGRRLSNPHSIARGLGPICYRKSGGGAFDRDMEVADAEWERRAEDLRRGGEWDFGYWDWVMETEWGPVVMTRAMRVSTRFRDGAFEAYGERFLSDGTSEDVVFYRGDNIREAWRAAIAAGPESNAMAYRVKRETERAWKAQAKRGGIRG